MKKKQHKSIFQSIRKQIARPTIVMRNKKEELLMESINKDEELNELPKFAVDIPNANDYENNFETWINVNYFDTKEEAIAFCKETFHSDDEGKINLITEV